jgi:hypothetical protein
MRNAISVVMCSILSAGCGGSGIEPLNPLIISEPTVSGSWSSKTGVDSNGEDFGFITTGDDSTGAVIHINCLSGDRIISYLGTFKKPQYDLIYAMSDYKNQAQAVLPINTQYWSVYGGLYASTLENYEVNYLMGVWRDGADVVLHLTAQDGLDYNYSLPSNGFLEAFGKVCQP